MNNLDRITEELAHQAAAMSSSVGLSPDEFLEVALAIVEAEDEHRINQTNINQQVRTIILNAAGASAQD